MARRRRLDVPGYPQHVIQRGNNRNACFFEDRDYRAYLEFLGLAIAKTGCRLHAYVLMTNHVHLLLTGQHVGAISGLMQSLGRRYVRFINRQYRRTGSLWDGRFKSSLIASDRYLLACYRYVEMNPVRAGLVRDPGDYPWSSFRHHVNKRRDLLIDDHELFRALGPNREMRAERYRKLFREPLEEPSLQRIRRSIDGGRVLGSERFGRRARAASGRRLVSPKESG